METFAAAFAALYVGHHIGDYWIQTDHQARHKGDAGSLGRLNCLAHVLSYLATQLVTLWLVTLVTGLTYGAWQLAGALALSGVTHFTADRREHGLMFWLARRIPGKAAFLGLGKPRPALVIETMGLCPTCSGAGTAPDESTGGRCWDCRGGGQLPSHAVLTDNPTLGTGAWALDQSWHLLFGVFLPALVLAL